MNGGRGSSPLERIVQHVLQGIVVVSIVGLFVVISELRTTTAVTKTEVIALREHLVTFRAQINDRYTGAQAARDLKFMATVNEDQESRLRRLERRPSSIDLKNNE